MAKPFYDARYDAVFKNAVARDEEVFKYFLKYALEREIKSYRIIPNELPKKEFSIKSKTLDINVKTDIGNIIVEINNGFYTSLPIRNLAYLSSVFSNSVSRGDSYDNVPLHILLNITWGKGIKGEILTEYYVQSEKGIKYCDRMLIREINMDLLLNIWYYGDKDKALNYSHFLMLGLNMKELKALCKEKGYKFMKKYMDNVEELNNDTEFVNVISPEKDNEMVINTLKNEAIKEGREEGKKEGMEEGRREGREEGIKQGIKEGKKEGYEQGIEQGIEKGIAKGTEQGMKEGMKAGKEKGAFEKAIETAKNMLNKGLDIKLVSECTGLSVKEVEGLR